MPEYQDLTEEELLHLAGERQQLTDEARFRLDAELSRRGISRKQIEAYESESRTLREEEQRDVGNVTTSGRIGKHFYGRSNY
jgi:hypothetical protein